VLVPGVVPGLAGPAGRGWSRPAAGPGHGS